MSFAYWNRPHQTKRFVFLFLLLLSLAPAALAQDEDEPIDLPGQVAYIGVNGNVYTYILDEGRTTQLTDDATAVRQYEWPTWSNGGELAYFCCDAATSRQPGMEVYISPDGQTPGEEVYTLDDGVFTYAAWSPLTCDAGEGCRDLAILVSLLGQGSFGVDIVRNLPQAETTTTRAGTGAPYYYSWSPDGSRLLTQRNTERVDIYNLADDTFERSEIAPGRFPAPAWSPVDDRLLVGRASATGDGTDLVIVTPDGQREVLQADLDGQVAFNWSPDGNLIAYRTLTQDGPGDLVVLDAVTGDVVASTEGDEVFAFFWSPDSHYLAYITTAAPPGTFNISYTGPSTGRTPSTQRIQEDGLRWAVLDVQQGNARSYGSFVPTREMLYLVSYFNQFAQSHSLWSPDSTHIVFSEVTSDGARVVSILDMTRRDAVPFFIANGAIGIWSYE